jgi:hypothetical protein
MAIQKKSTWLFCLTLSVLYAVIVNAYYLYPFSRVLEQAGWGDKLHWLEFSFEAGTLLGMVVLIPLTTWHFPTKYLCITSAWALLAAMLGTGYLIVFQVPALWLLISLRAITGICTAVLFQACLDFFHWGIWQKGSGEKGSKTNFEQAIGEEQSRRNNLCILLGSSFYFVTFWQLGTNNSSHLAWFSTVLGAMAVFALLMLGTYRFPKKLAFPKPKESMVKVSTQPVSLSGLFTHLAMIYAPAWAMLVAVNTYLQRYLPTFVMIPLITVWGLVAGSMLGNKLASKLAPCWNSLIVQTGFGLISVCPVLFWLTKSPVVLALALLFLWIGISFQGVVINRVLLVHVPEKQKIPVQNINSLAHKPGLLLVAPIGTVESVIGLRWMWLTILVLVPIGIFSAKRFRLLQQSEADKQERRHSFAGVLLGVTLHFTRRW